MLFGKARDLLQTGADQRQRDDPRDDGQNDLRAAIAEETERGIPDAVENDGESEEEQEPAAQQLRGGKGLLALRSDKRGACDRRPDDVSAEREDAAQKGQVDHEGEIAHQQIAEGITGGFKDGEACADARAEEQTVQNVLGVRLFDVVGNDDHFACFLNKTDEDRADVGKLAGAGDAIEDQRADQREHAADEEHGDDAENADVSRHVHLPEEDDQRERHGHRAHEHEAGVGVCVPEEGQHQVEQQAGGCEEEEYAGIEPRLGPLRGDLRLRRGGLFGAADEELFGFVLRMLPEHLGDEVGKVYVNGSAFADLLVQRAGDFSKSAADIVGGVGGGVTAGYVQIPAAVCAESGVRLDRFTAEGADTFVRRRFDCLLCAAFRAEFCRFRQCVSTDWTYLFHGILLLHQHEGRCASAFFNG